jgi:1-acyl-sn-glycerol-3-phosphate acyltransferase
MTEPPPISAPPSPPAGDSGLDDTTTPTRSGEVSDTRRARAAARRSGDLPPVRPITRGERWFYGICRTISVGASRVVFVGGVIGKEHVPKDGPFIVAPIHRSYVDWLVAARVSHKRLRYIVKGEVWRIRAAGRLLEMLGAFPIHRGAADREALMRAIEILRAGEPLVIFPEGTRGFGPFVPTIHEGAAYIALRAGVPIIPVGMAGVERAMPRGHVIPRPARVVVAIGPPITTAVEAAADRTRVRVTRAATRALTEELRLGIEGAQHTAEAAIDRHRHSRRDDD